jgi:hypothetical protein
VEALRRCLKQIWKEIRIRWSSLKLQFANFLRVPAASHPVRLRQSLVGALPKARFATSTAIAATVLPAPGFWALAMHTSRHVAANPSSCNLFESGLGALPAPDLSGSGREGHGQSDTSVDGSR